MPLGLKRFQATGDLHFITFSRVLQDATVSPSFTWVPPAEGRSESDSVLPFLLPAAQPVKPQNSKTPLQTR